ncbi:hypothetical protein QEH59_18880, partial [Coraliomargarita sp. SDUM461004]
FDPLFAWHENEASHGVGDWSNIYILRLTPFGLPYVAAVAIEATEGDSIVVNVRLAWKSMKFETSSLDNSAIATSNGSTTWNRQTNDTTYP